jgi:hypothetical protein
LLVPKRNSTLTALQALATLNNPFVAAQAENFARRLEAASADRKKQVHLAYLIALGRAPDEKESRLLHDYAAKHGLANACRVIFNTTEFVFVD